jgi:hypothetical protein
MKHILFISSLFILLLSLSGCTPEHHPKHPKYEIIKPTVKYKANKKNLAKMVKKLQGRPYVWAEEGPNYFDCSGFTYYMYGSMGIEIPRVAREQARQGKRIKPSELKYGDLIFFDTNRRRRGRITHVGMYLGNGWFTHASTVKYEVVYSNLRTSKYYKKRLRICRRYLPEVNKPMLNTTLTPWESQASTPILVPKKSKTPKIMPIPIYNKGTFYVQIGSFSNKPHSSLLYSITKRGYHYKLIEFPANGTMISKLLVGPYKTRTQALKILPHIKEEIKESAFIAEIR